MFVIAVTFLLIISHGAEPIALAVDCIERALPLHVVAELSKVAVCIGCGVKAANVSARGGCIDRVDEWVTFPVHKVARTANYAVVAVVVFLAVVAVKLGAFL